MMTPEYVRAEAHHLGNGYVVLGTKEVRAGLELYMGTTPDFILAIETEASLDGDGQVLVHMFPVRNLLDIVIESAG